MEFFRNDVFAYIAVVSLGFHAFNGIRLIFIELTSLTLIQRETAYLSLLSGAIFGMYYMNIF
jgi:succinate dehydrogenase/fumarate reductase cytochrome b subunit